MVFPEYLNTGDQVAIIATARKVSKAEIEPALDILRSWGLVPLTSPHIFEEENQFSGTEQQRIEDLQWAINHPEIKAVFCARGGYGTSPLLDSVDYSGLKKYPKWFVGFSDVTALHAQLNVLGMPSIHATMPILFPKKEQQKSVDVLKNVVFGQNPQYTIQPEKGNKIGEAKGKLIGGNLSLLVHLIGTPSCPNWQDAILFIEDLDEYLYHVDRMMVQLERNQVFSKIKGLLVGGLSDMNDNTIPFGKTAEEIVLNRVEKYKIPVAFGFPAGHVEENLPLILGVDALIKVTENNVILNYINTN